MKKIALVLAVAAGVSMSPLGNAYGAVYNGWEQSNGYWYYYQNGSMCTGWVKDSGTWYYMNPSGDMATGWKNVNGAWYYLNGNGSMKTGWLNDGGTWYYLNADGDMAVGWVKDNGKWYYMNGNGSMKTGWLNDGGTWYYLESDGALASDISVGGYYVNRDGVWNNVGDNEVIVSTDKAQYDAGSNDIAVKVINNTSKKVKFSNDVFVRTYTSGKYEDVADTFNNDKAEEIELEPYASKVIFTKFSDFVNNLKAGLYDVGFKINGENVSSQFRITGINNNAVNKSDNNVTMKTSKDKYNINETDSIPFTVTNGSNEEKGFTEGYWIEKQVSNLDYETVKMKDIVIPDVYNELKPGEKYSGTVKLSDMDEKLEAGNYRICKNIGGKTVYGYFELSNDNIVVMNGDKKFYYDDDNTMKLTLTNNSDEEISYENAYKIEKHAEGGKWENVSLKNDEFTEEAIIIKPHDKSVQTIDLGNINEEKIRGDYRIVKEIEGSKYYAEFSYGYKQSTNN